MDLNWKYVPSETTALPTEPLSLLWARLCIYHSKDHSSLVVENGTRFNGSVHFHSNTNIWAYSMIFLNGAYPASFSLFSSFQNKVDSKQMFNIIINFYRWLDLNHGPLYRKQPLYQLSHNHCPLFNECLWLCFVQ